MVLDIGLIQKEVQWMVDIILEFEGIIGAILGSVVTLIITDILQNQGKIKQYLMSYEAKVDTYEDVGCSQRGKEGDDIYGYGIKYEFQIYNGYKFPKIMRKFNIEFYKDKKLVMSIIPKDESNRRFSCGTSRVEDVEIANIQSYEITSYIHSAYIVNWEENFKKLNGVNRIALVYYDEKEKKHTIVLSEKEIDI